MSMLRTRWAAVGAAVAIALGAGGVSLSQAALTSGDKPVYVALDAPCRVIDTRAASPIGAGPANALTVQITGPNGDCTGSLAVPAAAVAVATNVTVIQPNGAASGRSFFTVYPADAALPTTSNLNFVNGQPPTPNKVDVGLSTDGKIKIYNNDGTAHAAVDIFGYYIDHIHDDRYYTESEVDGALATKADASDTYTKSEVDGALAAKANLPQGRGHLILSGADFIPSSLAGGTKYNFLSGSRSGGAIDDSTCIVAPVHLPHGVTVTTVTVYSTDTGSGDVNMFLRRFLFDGSDGDTMASVPSTDNSGDQAREDTTISHPVVNTVHFAYVLDSCNYTSSDVTLKTVVIEFAHP